MMRVWIIGCLAAMGAWAPAQAYENFIPMGTGYSTQVGELAPIDDDVIARADEHETEIYRFGRDSIEADSRLRQFFSTTEGTGTDTYIDY